MMIQKEICMLVKISSLKAAILCVADDREIRTCLKSVFVDGENVVATNGHIAYIEKMIDNGERPFEVLIDATILKDFLKKVNKKETHINVNIGIDVLICVLSSIDADGNEISTSFRIESKYVDYKRAFGNAKFNFDNPTSSIKLNLDYLTILGKINKIIGQKHTAPTLNFNGGHGMVMAEWELLPDSKFYVMPMRQ